MRPSPCSTRKRALGLQARDWLDRHRRMVAWNKAVLINTAAGYRAFLAQYPDSDLTPTARKLEERLRNRPNFVAAVAAAGGAPAASGAAAGRDQRLAQRPDLPVHHAGRRRAGQEGRQAEKARRAGSVRSASSASRRDAITIAMMTTCAIAVRRRVTIMCRIEGRPSASASAADLEEAAAATVAAIRAGGEITEPPLATGLRGLH